MNLLLFLSDAIIPILIFSIIGYGLLNHHSIYDDFIKVAKDCFHTVIFIMPPLIVLIVGVGILRASGFLDLLSSVLGVITEPLRFPAELVPVSIVKMFSSSAATGLVLDIFKEFGPDSYFGIITSIMMSCTETIFYTMSIYFMTAKVQKTRYTLPGALFTTLIGTVASVILAQLM